MPETNSKPQDYEKLADETVNHIDKNLLSAAEKPDTLYRACRMLALPDGKSVEDTFVSGYEFLHPSVFSSSRSLRVALDFAEMSNKPKEPDFMKDTIFVIHVRELAYLVDVDNISRFRGEKEVLVYPYTGFKVEAFRDRGPSHKIERYVIVLSTQDTYKICQRGFKTLYDWSKHGLNAPKALDDATMVKYRQNPKLWFSDEK